MTQRLVIGLLLFMTATVAYLSLSSAPAKMDIATIVPWFVVAALASCVAWAPILSSATRSALLAVVAAIGSALLLYANTAFSGKMEPSLKGYLMGIVEVVVVLAVFLPLTSLIARVFAKWRRHGAAAEGGKG